MANEIRVRTSFKNGTITDNPLTNVATTINSAAFANLPTIDATNHLLLVLDPTGSAGTPEIVLVTAHTASATSVTVTRGQEQSNGGSAARQHASGIAWRHSATALDFPGIYTSATRPSVGLYEGYQIYEQDTDRQMVWTGALWRQPNNPPACRVTRAAGTQSLTDNVWAVMNTLDTEKYDTDSMHDNVTNNSRITINTAGLYLVTANVMFAFNATGMRAVGIRKNGVGTSTEGDTIVQAVASIDVTAVSHVVPMKLAAGDYIEMVAIQHSGGALTTLSSDGSPVFSATWIGVG